MPLLPGKKNIGRNIATEEAAGKPRPQAIAIALDVARRTEGGDPVDAEKEGKKEKMMEMRVPTMEKKEPRGVQKHERTEAGRGHSGPVQKKSPMGGY